MDNGGADAEVRDLIVTNLARVRALELPELQQQLVAGGGNVEVISEQAVVVIAALEKHYGRKLPGIQNLRRDKPITISSLTGLLTGALRPPQAAAS